MARDHIATIRSARQKLLEERRQVIELLDTTGHSEQLHEQIDRLKVIQRGLDLLEDALAEEEVLAASTGPVESLNTGDAPGWTGRDPDDTA